MFPHKRQNSLHVELISSNLDENVDPVQPRQSSSSPPELEFRATAEMMMGGGCHY